MDLTMVAQQQSHPSSQYETDLQTSFWGDVLGVTTKSQICDQLLRYNNETNREP